MLDQKWFKNLKKEMDILWFFFGDSVEQALYFARMGVNGITSNHESVLDHLEAKVVKTGQGIEVSPDEEVLIQDIKEAQKDMSSHLI